MASLRNALLMWAYLMVVRVSDTKSHSSAHCVGFLVGPSLRCGSPLHAGVSGNASSPRPIFSEGGPSLRFGSPLDASSEATHLVRARSFLRADPHFVAGLRYTQEFQAMRPVRARSFLRADPHFVAGLRYTQEFQAMRPVRARSFLRADPRRSMWCTPASRPPRRLVDHFECNSVSRVMFDN